jgi:hypothetical protein
MIHLPYLLAALLSFYAVLGAVFLYRALQPTCRICLNRDTCPNRRQGFGRPVCTPPSSRRWFARANLRGDAVSREL